MKTKILKATYEGYTGKKHWKVTHPDYKESVTACAPDSQAAIVAAAKALNTEWTAYRFYAFAEVSPA